MGGIRWREVNLLGGFVNRRLSEGARRWRLHNWEIIVTLYFRKKERKMVKKVMINI